MSYSETISEIKQLPHYRDFTCKACGHKQKVYRLFIHANCEKCGTRTKLRGYAAIGSEIEDVVDAVLEWLGQDKELEEAMKWKQVLDSSEE